MEDDDTSLQLLSNEVSGMRSISVHCNLNRFFKWFLSMIRCFFLDIAIILGPFDKLEIHFLL